MWKVIFITLLIINVIFVALAIFAGSQYMGSMTIAYLFIPLTLPLAIIDLVAIVSYIIKQHPHKPSVKSRILSDVALIIIGFAIIFSGVLVYVIANVFD